MTNPRPFWANALICVSILAGAFVIGLLLQSICPSQSLVSMLFVLAVFLISLFTNGYFWGICAACVAVLVDNFVFTFPYFAFDFLLAENLIAALVMLIVAVLASTLTTQLKSQERIKSENEAEKMRANLLRAVSHDLRTPLTTIYGSASAIMDNFDSLAREQKLSLLGQIREDSDGMIRMVENLLSVTRVGDEQIRIRKTPTVLEELVDASLMKFHKHYPGQEVLVDIPEEFISIPMDAMLIRQVLINLLENAVLHAQGMTELRLRVFTREGGAYFEVRDNGCGIPKDRLERIFSGQVYGHDIPSDAGHGGMGIGLSVCAAIINAHGGQIQAENIKDGGACFRFRLEMEEFHEQ